MLKTLLVNAPLLCPLNYHRDFTLYLAATFSTIAMVLVQDDDDGTEHVIYYLSQNLLDPETCYAHVKKLALVAIQATQHFHHYILLRKVQAMNYILS